MNTYHYLVEHSRSAIKLRHAREDRSESGLITAITVLGYTAVRLAEPKTASGLILPNDVEIAAVGQSLPEHVIVRENMASVDTPPSKNLEEFVERCKAVWSKLIAEHGPVYKPVCSIYQLHTPDEDGRPTFHRHVASPDESEAIEEIFNAIPIHHDPSEPPVGMFP